jgi:flagellar protein FliS
MKAATQTNAAMEEIRRTAPSRLVVMLYDGIIAALESAVEAIEDGDVEKRCRCVNLAIEIVSYLYMSLDMEKGGEIATNLGKLYRFFINETPRINRDNDAQLAYELIKLIEPLHRAWTEVDSEMVASPALAVAAAVKGKAKAARRAPQRNHVAA